MRKIHKEFVDEKKNGVFGEICGKLEEIAVLEGHSLLENDSCYDWI
jgi:hypothetical protein